MKLSKIPGLGRFGIYIDDVDVTNMSHEEWMEIGKIHLESLVTVIRGQNLDHTTYYNRIMEWGPARWNRPMAFYQKYGKPLKDLILNHELDQEDQTTVDNGRRWQVDKRCPGMIRVTPRKNSKGETMGAFAGGELLWHSNECGDTAFTPGVALMGWDDMIGTATGFCTSPDWYEKQTEAFRSELDDMVIVHNYKPASVSPVVIEDQENFYRNNFTPETDMRVPLVIYSPGGIKGVHLGVNTFDQVEGMTKEASNKLFEKIRSEMIVPEYCYDHWYETNKDICLFDNSITLHNRSVHEQVGIAPNRVGYRIQYDFNNLAGNYRPFIQEEFNIRRNERLELLAKATEGMIFK